MSDTAWPIDISTATNDVSAGVFLWTQHQQLYATVAVKTTFSLVPSGTMTLCAPRPLEPTERMMSQGPGIEPGDLAPCLMMPEIWVRGHAWYPPAAGARSVRVRLALARDRELLLRKSVEFPVSNDSFVPPYLHAFAPLSRTWPVRTRLLGAFDWTDLEQVPMELPDVFDWRYFQCAPADQQLEPLRGDEWIRLEAMHSSIFKFDTQLPSATCAIRLYGRVGPFREGTTVRSGLDTIQIDVDQGTCALVFRGHAPIPANFNLGDLQFVAGIGLPGRPLPNLEATWNLLGNGENDLPPVEEDPSILVTSFVDVSMISALVPSPKPSALPFRKGPSTLALALTPPPPRHEQPDAGQTLLFDERLLDTIHPENALPFHERSSESRPPAPNHVPPEKPAELPIAPLILPSAIAPNAQGNGFSLPSVSSMQAGSELDAGSTFFLSEDMLAALEGKDATPFVGGEPLPEREEPVDTRAGLPFRGLDEEPGEILGLGGHFLAALQQHQACKAA
ncbi:MAG TPA: DUF2169 domain-containing protein [Polyangium sp.]|nr:DUF2169 domain-containing protein [Polyangium sp.]